MEEIKDIIALVVDDEEGIRKLIKSYLKHMGINDIIESKDGAQALQILQDEEVHLIIADWRMPRKSGIELLKIVRASEKYKGIPFVMVTSADGKEEILEAMNAKVSQYIVKPFTADTFHKKVMAALQH